MIKVKFGPHDAKFLHACAQFFFILCKIGGEGLTLCSWCHINLLRTFGIKRKQIICIARQRKQNDFISKYDGHLKGPFYALDIYRSVFVFQVLENK